MTMSGTLRAAKARSFDSTLTLTNRLFEASTDRHDIVKEPEDVEQIGLSRGVGPDEEHPL